MSKIKKPLGSATHKGLAFIVMGFLLIAMPSIVQLCGYNGEIVVADERVAAPFDRSLIFLMRHDIGGAVGVIVNRPLTDAQRAKLSPFLRDADVPVFYGGPVGLPDRILVLEEHDPATPGGTPQYNLDDWDDAVRETPDLLRKIRESVRSGEQRYRLFAGYAVWGSFELESEMYVRNDWYAIPASHDIVFQNGKASQWDVLESKEKAKRVPRVNQS